MKYPKFEQLPKTVQNYIKGLTTLELVRSKRWTLEQLYSMKNHYKEGTEYRENNNY